MHCSYIVQMIEEDLTYDYLHSSEDNLWSILYLTGYLTRVREIPVPDGAFALTIDEYDEILCYGIAFYKKRCLVRREPDRLS